METDILGFAGFRFRKVPLPIRALRLCFFIHLKTTHYVISSISAKGILSCLLEEVFNEFLMFAHFLIPFVCTPVSR